jgi:hypothetical protein
MPSRDVVAAGLVELRTWWPSMPDSVVLVESISRVCEGYDDVEFTAAVRILVKEHGAAWPPKPADYRAACGRVAAVRRRDTVMPARANREDAYCTFCGSRDLTWSPPWPNGQSRMIVLHAHECSRRDAGQYVPAPVNMASWPGHKPRGSLPAGGRMRGPESLCVLVERGENQG